MTQPQREPSTPHSSNRLWRLTFIAGVILVVVLVALGVTYALRGLIIERYTRSWLQDHGIDSDLDVRALSLTGLEARIRLGPAGAPVLRADNVKLKFRLTGPWNGEDLGVQPSSMIIVRPYLAARYDGHRLNFGVLQKLIHDFLAQPLPPGTLLPDVVIQDGTLDLETPYGPLSLTGRVAARGGQLDAVDARLAQFNLTRSGEHIVSPGAHLSVTRSGGVLTANLTSDIQTLAVGPNQARDASVIIWARLPYPDGSGLHGRTRILIDLKAGQARSGLNSVANLTTHGLAEGVLAADEKGLSLTGTLNAQSSLERASYGATQAQHVAASVQVGGLRSNLDGQRLQWSGRLSGQIGVKSVNTSSGRLSDMTIAVTGPASDRGVRLDGKLIGRGSLNAVQSKRLITKLKLDQASPAYALATQRAMTDFRWIALAWRLQTEGRSGLLDLLAPVDLTSGSGARLKLTPRPGVPLIQVQARQVSGALDLALSGGALPQAELQVARWAGDSRSLSADLDFKTALDLPAAKGLKLEVRGTATSTPTRLGFSLSECAALSLQPPGGRSAQALRGSLRLCGGDGPLIVLAGGRWAIHGRLEDVDLQGGDVSLNGKVLQIAAEGTPAGPTVAKLKLHEVALVDTAAEKRFAPMIVNGQADLAQKILNGDISLSTPKGVPLAKINVHHDLRTRLGHAGISATDLNFLDGGLQPADFAPQLGVVRRTHGHVDFTGAFDWTPEHLTSRGTLTTRDLGFTTPAGDVIDLGGAVQFTSLVPMITAANQTLTVRRVDGVVPLTGVQIGFDLNQSALNIQRATAILAAGRISVEPLQISLEPNATLQGAVLIDHVDLGALIAGSSLASSIKVTAIINGRLPFDAGPKGIHFLQGRLDAVGPGRISIAREALTGVSTSAGSSSSTIAPSNAVQDFAYQAMENLAFDTFNAQVNSAPGERLDMLFHIKGRHDPVIKKQTVISLSALANGTAFDKPLPLPSGTAIDLTLDTTLNFGELVTAIADIWRGGRGEDIAVTPSSPVQAKRP